MDTEDLPILGKLIDITTPLTYIVYDESMFVLIVSRIIYNLLMFINYDTVLTAEYVRYKF